MNENFFTCENCCREIETEVCPYCGYDNANGLEDLYLDDEENL